MFLKLKDIEGESKDHKHKAAIDILAWSWGMSQSGSTHMGGGGGAGKVSIQDLSITKYIDKASPNLMQHCCDGTHIEEATLTVRKAGKEQQEYLTITLKEILVTAVSTGGSGGEDRLTENVTLNFAQYKTAYKEQKADGTLAAPIFSKWNIPENKDTFA